MATGEVWFGADAVEKGLVDELQTSSEYIMHQIRQGHEVLEVTYKEPKKGLGSLGLGAEALSQLAEAFKSQDLGVFGALRGALPGFPTQPSDLSALQALNTLQALEGGAWPKGVPEPRLESSNAQWEAQLKRNLPEI